MRPVAANTPNYLQRIEGVLVVCCVMSKNKSLPTLPEHNDPKIPVKERKTVETLQPGDCRWPIGDPLHQDFHFCGKHKAEGDPYCEVHMRRGFQAQRPRLTTYRPRAIT